MGILLLALPAATAPLPSGGEVDVRFEGLRSTRGMLRACLTREPQFFPHCERDPAALKASVAAGTGASLRFERLPPGDYALMVLHDENGNARMDTMFGIPREGVGFSRNPVLRMGPPAFQAVRFPVMDAPIAQSVRLRYFL